MPYIERTRSLSGDETTAFYLPFTHYQNGSLISQEAAINYVTTSELDKVMSDRIWTDYAMKRRRGDIVMNPVLVFTSRVILQSVIQYTESSSFTGQDGNTYVNTYVYEGLLGASLPGIPDAPQGLIDATISGMHSEHQGSVGELLTSVGEFGKTLELILGLKKRAAEKVVNIFKPKRHRRTRKHREKANVRAARILDQSSSIYLEARYGWRPLVYEIESLSEALADEVVNIKRALKRTSYTLETTDTVVNTYPQGFNLGGRLYDMEDTITTRHVAKAVIISRVNPSLVSEFDARWGTASFISTLWELFPFSFMIDWVINIGDYIGSYENSSNILDSTSCITITSHTVFRRVVDGKVSLSERTKIERIPNPPKPISPSFNFRFDFAKGLDTFAIARSLVKKHSHLKL